MPLDLSRRLVVGISSTALFDQEAFNPHIFFGDQDVHVESASERVPTGKVLYRTDSRLRALQAERDEGNGRKNSSA